MFVENSGRNVPPSESTSKMRERPSDILPQANAICLPSGEKVGEYAVQGIVSIRKVDLRAVRSIRSNLDEFPCERTSRIDRLSGAKTRSPILPLSKCPCVPFHAHASEVTTTTAAVLAAKKNSFLGENFGSMRGSPFIKP